MRTTVTKIFTFDAAHFLPDYDGPCSQMHGHTYKVEVTVEGPVENGMVCDFTNLDRLCKPLIAVFDHSVLNDFIDNPTAENIACHIQWKLSAHIGTVKLHAEVTRVRVWETPTSYATVEAE